VEVVAHHQRQAAQEFLRLVLLVELVVQVTAVVEVVELQR
jgi:hypothetical protein